MRHTHQALADLLYDLDGRSYPAYKRLKGRWSFPDFDLHFDRIQGDPFASPSQVSLVIPVEGVQLPADLWRDRVRRIGTQDGLLRRFAAALEAERPRGRMGSGRSGEVRIAIPGQAILERSACQIDEGDIILCFRLGLPGNGRRIAGRQAHRLLCEWLPDVVAKTLLDGSVDLDFLFEMADAMEDQSSLRQQLAEHDLVAFIADGSLLPRRSGVDDRPMDKKSAQLWQGPKSMRLQLVAPNSGTVVGTGIKRGVTLICGGGFHGKSTLLEAISQGIYNHIPGDGREGVVSIASATKIRAEDGRRVASVDISNFINNLPMGRSTTAFASEDASGSTSQAAAISEAMELGVGALIIDEDTSATNFMIRDRRMQQLVRAEREPIRPLVDSVRSLYESAGLSTILVIGGSGDYLDVADAVLLMDAYMPHDRSQLAQEIAEKYPTQREKEAHQALVSPRERVIDWRRLSADLQKSRRTHKVRDGRQLQLGQTVIQTHRLSQLLESDQLRCIALGILDFLEKDRGQALTMAALAQAFDERLAVEGPGAFMNGRSPDLTWVRGIECVAILNRLRTLEIKRAGN